MKKLIEKTPKNLRQFIKFCIVGAASSIINIATYILLTRFLGLYYIAADVLAYLISLINSYYLNRNFTFRNNHKKIGIQLAKYIIVYTVGMISSAGLLYVFVNELGIHDLFAKFLVIGVVMIWNFIGSKFLIFDRDEQKDAKSA